MDDPKTARPKRLTPQRKRLGSAVEKRQPADASAKRSRIRDNLVRTGYDGDADGLAGRIERYNRTGK